MRDGQSRCARHSNETVCFHLAALVARRLRRERTLATKVLTTPRFAIFRSHRSAYSNGSIASAHGFDRSRWRACLKSPHFHSERKTEAVRKDGDGISPIKARRVRPRIAGYHPVSGHLTKE